MQVSKDKNNQSIVKSVKLIAMYFPQLHAIPENDAWWGKGFTDWNNVQSASPQYEGHYQPRVPLNNNYYDQSKIETLRWQVGLAKQYGIYGFCHYHYWFDGKQLLETPTNLIMENKDIDFPQRIDKIDDMLAYWRDLAIKDGLSGVYFVFQKQYELPNKNCLNSFDALFQFQPFEAVESPSFNEKSIRHYHCLSW